MATLGDMISRICDDLDRDSSEIGDAVSREIKSAIEFYQGERFWFNTEVFNTSLSATSIYSLSALSFHLIEPDSVLVTDSAGTRFTLEPVNYQVLNSYDSTAATGIPWLYTIYNDSLRVYPTPDTTYVATISGTAQYTELAADADTNCWTTEAEQLIRKHAMAQVARQKLGDHELADRLELEIMSDNPPGILARFRRRSRANEGTGYIVPWD